MHRFFMAVTILLSSSLAIANGLVPLPPQPTDVPWPTKEWSAGPLPQGVDVAAFNAAMDEAFNQTTPHLGETREVVVIQGGRLVYERAASGYRTDMPLVSWSMAKSVTHALVGVAVREGKVDAQQPMGNPHWSKDDKRAQIPWRTWLNMTDGMEYVEIQAKTIADSDASRKLFGPGRLDVAKYCSGLPLIHEPDTYWNYNSCGIVLTADALTRSIVPTPSSPQDRRAQMLAWMHANLFDVIGMKAQPEFDATGLFYGSAFVYASARDFAKFGLLYMRDGTWEGTRVLPEGWVDFARTPGPGKNSDIYGAGWWVSPAQGEGTPYAFGLETGAVRDAFAAQGFEGQYTLLVPSKDLIIVRLGLTTQDDQRSGALGQWLGKVARFFPVVQ
jgi:CubicO group peptidase (beta-lactamase class C family)